MQQNVHRPKTKMVKPTSMRVSAFGWLVGLVFKGLLRQYFSLYRAVSQREGDVGWLVVLGLTAL